MKSLPPFYFQNRQIRTATVNDVPALRQLVNAAYKQLADMGLNYSGASQDEAVTLRRLSEGTPFVIEEEGRLIATVILRKHNLFTGRNTAYVNQLAVSPECKGQGLGNLLMDLCETLAEEQNYEAIQLDTAAPATHLVSWYLRRGYKIIGTNQWEGKTYASYALEKSLKSGNKLSEVSSLDCNSFQCDEGFNTFILGI